MSHEYPVNPGQKHSGKDDLDPFSLGSEAAYLRWRAMKLDGYPTRVEEIVVDIANPGFPTPAEIDALRGCCRKANMAVYRSRIDVRADKDIPLRLASHFGLTRLDTNLLADEDSLTSIKVFPEKSGRGYIPYSCRRLLWHTDGYYNPPERRVRAFLLHCVSPAAEGGENALLDPEIAYIRLRDENPEHVRSLMAGDVLTIPPNTEDEGRRPASVGPVFAVDSADGSLHMRYTARTRSIQWKDDARTRAAVQALERLLSDDSSAVFRYRLHSGEGLLCNNVLHNRSAFRDETDSGRQRLLYRARFYDRIAGTGLNDIYGG